MIVFIFEHAQWRWALNGGLARGQQHRGPEQEPDAEGDRGGRGADAAREQEAAAVHYDT